MANQAIAGSRKQAPSPGGNRRGGLPAAARKDGVARVMLRFPWKSAQGGTGGGLAEPGGGQEMNGFLVKACFMMHGFMGLVAGIFSSDHRRCQLLIKQKERSKRGLPGKQGSALPGLYQHRPS